jgi:aspartate/methionine/tyrosine aminotransferase
MHTSTTSPLFRDQDVNLPVLRARAHNMRWATFPDGVIPLTAADPDFPTAPPIRDSLRTYADAGVFSYGPAEGLPELRDAIARTLTRRKGHAVTTSQIVVTDGAASALYLAARFALRPGDEAIVFDPGDFLFARSVEAAGARVVRCPLDPNNDAIVPDVVERLITRRTRMIAVCNPHNPTGHVPRRAELEAVAALAKKYDIWILSDEVWSDIVYAPLRHIPTASLDAETAARTLTIHGFSKSFGLAGLRIGYLVAPCPDAAETLLSASGASSTAYGASTLSQVAATAAYTSCWEWQEAFVAHLARMRGLAMDRLARIPGLSCREPEATFVLFPDARAFDMTSDALAQHLLEAARVAVVPGSARYFGPRAEGHLRLSFATSERILLEALDRIDHALRQLR